MTAYPKVSVSTYEGITLPSALFDKNYLHFIAHNVFQKYTLYKIKSMKKKKKNKKKEEKVYALNVHFCC